MTLPPLGLYIHLPWCERKCPYCDFNSHEAREIPEERYLNALLRDLETDLPLTQGRPIETLFVGGGTPSLFSGEAMQQLLRRVGEAVALSPHLEVTMEANPGSAEMEKFSAFRQAGINRLSIGVQSFQDEQLNALGRVHTSDEAHLAIEYARQAGFRRLNLDLMHGLPGQDLESAGADLRIAISHKPEHLSWYQLTIEPNTVFYNRPPPLPQEDQLADIQKEGEQLLAASGYGQYEISAFSTAGQACRHNLNYWTFGDYLGIGAGAHGKITFPDGGITRYKKTRVPGDYMDADQRGRHETVVEDVAGEFMMNALRLNAGFTRDLFEQRTRLLFTEVDAVVEDLASRGLLIYDGVTVHTSSLGQRFLDTVVADFFRKAL